MNRATTGALVLAKGRSFMIPRKLTAADLYDHLTPGVVRELDGFLVSRGWWTHLGYRFKIALGFFSDVEWTLFRKTADDKRYYRLHKFLCTRPPSFD